MDSKQGGSSSKIKNSKEAEKDAHNTNIKDKSSPKTRTAAEMKKRFNNLMKEMFKSNLMLNNIGTNYITKNDGKWQIKSNKNNFKQSKAHKNATVTFKLDDENIDDQP